MTKILLLLLLLPVAAFSQMPQAEFEKVYATQLSNDQKKAVAELETAEKKYPNTDKVYFLRAVYQYRDGDNTAAMVSHSNAIKANPKFAPAYDGRAELFFMKGMYDRAVADASRAIALEPKNIDFVTSRLKFYRANKQFAEALEDAKTRIKLNPEGIYGYLDAAVISKEANPGSNADVFFEQAYANKKIDKYVIDAIFGQFMLGQGRFEEAIAKYEQAHAAGEKYFEAEDYNNMAGAYYKIKKYDSAIVYFGRAMALKPDIIDYRNNLCGVYWSQQNWNRIKEIALISLEMDSEDAWANKYYAIGLANTGQETLADKYNEKAIRLGNEQLNKL